VERNEERRLADGLEDLSLSHGVLRGLRLLDDAGLLEYLHGVQLTLVGTGHFTDEEHLSVR